MAKNKQKVKHIGFTLRVKLPDAEGNLVWKAVLTGVTKHEAETYRDKHYKHCTASTIQGVRVNIVPLEAPRGKFDEARQ